MTDLSKCRDDLIQHFVKRDDAGSTTDHAEWMRLHEARGIDYATCNDSVCRRAQDDADALLASPALARLLAAARDEALREGEVCALNEAAEDVEVEMARAWGGSASWLTTGDKVASLVAYYLRDRAEDGSDD